MSKGLLDFYKLRDTLIMEGYNYPRTLEIMNSVEKELKALEIIKEKNVAITMIKQTNNALEYNLFANEFTQIKRVDKDKYKLSPQSLTQEEYELLKEVLL